MPISCKLVVVLNNVDPCSSHSFPAWTSHHMLFELITHPAFVTLHAVRTPFAPPLLTGFPTESFLNHYIVYEKPFLVLHIRDVDKGEVP